LHAQEIQSLGNGLRQLEHGRLTLITDLPIDDELKAWPAYLDQALEQWCTVWNQPLGNDPQLHVTACLIGDRGLFASAGLLQGVPAFDDGYQLNDTIFVVEQPSVYYRRHLFLHEATHWIMYRFFGGAGSPWFMEGTADMFGTHAIQEGKLFLNIIPKRPSEVPKWGRFKRLHEMLDEGSAPSLNEILAYGNERERRNDRYVWSWAATVFFWNHPEYSKALANASRPPLRYGLELSESLEKELRDQWPSVLADWNGFVSDFDFGYEPQRSMTNLADWLRESRDAPARVEVASDHGWQDTGIQLRAGESVHLAASGNFTLRKISGTEPWICGPNGITYQYHQHLPIGQLIATIVPTNGDGTTHRWKILGVGREQTVTSDGDGRLLLKINEPTGQLKDNEGALQVEILKGAKP
ncbi:MAG: hypothetical protein ACK5OB_02885, partial [Pirellula sp.]